MLTARPALVAEDFLASLIEAEVGARDASNAAARLKRPTSRSKVV